MGDCEKLNNDKVVHNLCKVWMTFQKSIMVNPIKLLQKLGRE